MITFLLNALSQAAQLDKAINSFYWGNPSNLSNLQQESPMLWFDEAVIFNQIGQNVGTVSFAFYILSHTEVGAKKASNDVYQNILLTPKEPNENGTTPQVFAGSLLYDENFETWQRVFQYLSYKLREQYTDIAEPRLVSALAYSGNADNDVGWRVEVEFDLPVNLNFCNPYEC